MLKKFKLIQKNKLTSNIYELVFESEQKNFKQNFKQGQFVTFILDKIGGRAYSVLDFLSDEKFILIIKKREEKDGGRGGSKYICEREIGDILNGVGPSGHFLLKENTKNKLFLATGTGFVPLYNQILGALEKKLDCKLKLIFGARTKNDLFYLEKLKNLKKQYNNFSYEIFLSKQEEKGEYKKGYVTNFLNKNNLEIFEEFYICGAPSMIESSIEKLKELGVNKENIFFEKY